MKYIASSITKTLLNPQVWTTIIAILATIAFIRVSWIADDAAITLRSILNFLNGYGPVFNVAERVQSFTHTLWFFLLSGMALVIGNVFLATFLTSIALSSFFVYLIVRFCREDAQLALCLVIIVVTSKAFMDFTSSGLENPLSHLLLFVFVGMTYSALNTQAPSDSVRNVVFLYGLTASALILTRPDFGIFAITGTIAISYMSHTRRHILSYFFGLLPTVVWTIFSIFYYGSPIPNSAMAKLNNHLPSLELASQGVAYLIESLQTDPISLSLIFVAISHAMYQRTAASLLLGGAMTLYLFYIVSVGGDFMSGRFITPILAMAISSFVFQKPIGALRLGVFLLPILGVGNINTNLLSGSQYIGGIDSSTGIADERGFYFPDRSIFNFDFASMPQQHEWRLNAEHFEVREICGLLGYHAISWGPSTYVVDSCALAHPLLARIPPIPDDNWRIGHFHRSVPVGFLEWHSDDTIPLTEGVDRQLIDDVNLVARGQLFTTKRLRAIIRLNTHDYGIGPFYLDEMFLFSRSEGFSAFARQSGPEYFDLTSDAINSAREAENLLTTLVNATNISGSQYETFRERQGLRAVLALQEALQSYRDAIAGGLSDEYGALVANEMERILARIQSLSTVE